MLNEDTPLDADELMLFADRVEQLPPAEAEWVGRLLQECMRARMHEAELIAGVADAGGGAGAAVMSPECDAQLAQMALDAAEWLKTLWEVGYMGAGSFPAQPRSSFPQVELEDVQKSALFARIREGKRPLPFPPPTRQGLPWHDLVDSADAAPDVTHYVDAELVRETDGQLAGVIIDACADWRVVEEVLVDREYVIQHRGQGPLYRLQLDMFASSLRREPPRWTRVIRRQERGGFRSYQLEWPQDDGRTQSVALRAATWERAESEAAYWIASHYPEMYGQVRFERIE